MADKPLLPEATVQFAMGKEHGFLMRMKRRCSVPSEMLVLWTEAEFEAFKLGVKETR